MPADQTLHDLRAARVIAVIRAATVRDALAVAHELLSAGLTALEITYTTPDASRVLSELAQDERVLLGAGTITTPAQADEAALAGASFLVSPGSPPDLIRAMQGSGLAVLPGVLTPTELMSALDLGVDAVKLFPAGAVGPSYLAQLHGPFPHARLIPTGGITVDNAGDWLAAGAWAVGAGGALAPARLEDAEDAARVHRRATELLARVGVPHPAKPTAQ